MATPKKDRHSIVARVPGTELLRLAHLGSTADSIQKRAAAESIYSLLALNLKNEMVDIPMEMYRYYQRLAR